MREEVGGWKRSSFSASEGGQCGQWIDSSEAADASNQFLREKLHTGVVGKRRIKETGKKTNQFSGDYNEVAKQENGYLSFVREKRSWL